MTDPTAGDIALDAGIGGYVRWRPRMVRLSVFNDLKTTLAATGWLTAHLEYPFEVKEFFPEFAVYQNDTVHVNTLTLDEGEPQPIEEWETGGEYSRLYRLNMAFYAQDAETGIAVFSDLSDRYDGLTSAPYLSLYDYSQETPPLICRMEVETYQWIRASLDVSPYEHHLYYGELTVRDFISADRVLMPG